MKKSLKILLTLCFVVPFAFIAVACGNDKKDNHNAATCELHICVKCNRTCTLHICATCERTCNDAECLICHPELFFTGTKTFVFSEYRLFGEVIGNEEFVEIFLYNFFLWDVFGYEGESDNYDEEAKLALIADFEEDTDTSYDENDIAFYKWANENMANIKDKYNEQWEQYFDWANTKGECDCGECDCEEYEGICYCETSLVEALGTYYYDIYQSTIFEFDFDNNTYTYYNLMNEDGDIAENEIMDFKINSDGTVTSKYQGSEWGEDEEYEYIEGYFDNNDYVWMIFGFDFLNVVHTVSA